MKVVLIRVIIEKIIINVVLKSEMGQYFCDNIFLQTAQLLWDGGSIRFNFTWIYLWKCQRVS